MLVLLTHDTQHEATCEIHLSVLCNIQFNNRESLSVFVITRLFKTGFIVMFQIKLCIFVQKRVKSYQNWYSCVTEEYSSSPFLAGFWMRLVYLCKKKKKKQLYVFFFLVRFTEIKTMPQYFRLSSAEILISWHIMSGECEKWVNKKVHKKFLININELIHAITKSFLLCTNMMLCSKIFSFIFILQTGSSTVTTGKYVALQVQSCVAGRNLSHKTSVPMLSYFISNEEERSV